jgi:hypothetical protein
MINTVFHPISRPTTGSDKAGDFLSVLLLAFSVALTFLTLANA